MEAPTPTSTHPKTANANDQNKLNDSQLKIINKKEYELKYENNIYNLQIQIDLNYIYFKIIQNKDEDIVQTFYKNKFDLKTITSILKLHPDIYNDLNKVISLLNDCYNTNKIRLSIKEKDVNIIITIINGNIEIECPIYLFVTKTGIDDKIEIIIDNIKLLKKSINNNSANNKILEIEKTIKDMQILINTKLEENENKIKELSSKFEKSENNVKILRDELFEIKKYIKEFIKFNYPQENNTIKNNNNNFLENKESISLDDKEKTNERNQIIPSANDNNINNNQIKNDNKSENKENREYVNNDIDIISENLEINLLIENQKNQHNSINNKKLCNNNDSQENIINDSFDNDIKEEYKTPKIKINIPKKFKKQQTMPSDYNRASYNSFYVKTPYNKKGEDLIINQNLNNNLQIKKNDNKNNANIDEIRKESYYSEKPTLSDNSSDDSSDFENRSSMVIFKSQKWKNKHSKRKLGCISEKIDAPILPVRNIPKFRIFKGFKSFQKGTEYK